MRPFLDEDLREITFVSAEGITGLVAGLAVVPALWVVLWLAVVVAKAIL